MRSRSSASTTASAGPLTAVTEEQLAQVSFGGENDVRAPPVC